MKAWELSAFGRENLRLVEKARPVPGKGQVLVRVSSVSLNYRDKLLVEGPYNPQLRFPIVQGSDAVGFVMETGPDVSRVRVGDRVMTNFATEWADGPPDLDASAVTLGNRISGAFSQYVVLDEQIAVHAPEFLSDEETATLPCAALTAWYALTARAGITPHASLLAQGTGGLSLFALQIGVALGAKVLVTSSSDEKLSRALALGASHGINCRKHPAWEAEVMKITGGLDVDHVLEVAGGDNLTQSIRATRFGGSISVVGVLDGAGAKFPLFPFIIRQLTLNGSTVGSRSALEQMLRDLEVWRLRPIIDAVYYFERMPDAYEHLGRGAFGKIVVSLRERAA